MIKIFGLLIVIAMVVITILGLIMVIKLSFKMNRPLVIYDVPCPCCGAPNNLEFGGMYNQIRSYECAYCGEGTVEVC